MSLTNSDFKYSKLLSNLNSKAKSVLEPQDETSNTFQFKQLGLEYLEEYKALRLTSLTTDPDSFLFSLDQERLNSQFHYRNQITNQGPDPFGLWGVLESTKLVGYTILSGEFASKKKHAANLYEVFILPEYRGRGLAKLLVRAVIEALKNTQSTHLYLSVIANNSKAISLYHSLGFKLVASIPNAINLNHDKFVDELIFCYYLS